MNLFFLRRIDGWYKKKVRKSNLSAVIFGECIEDAISFFLVFWILIFMPRMK